MVLARKKSNEQAVAANQRAIMFINKVVLDWDPQTILWRIRRRQQKWLQHHVAGPALAFRRPYANKNLAAPDHHKSQSVTIES